MVEMVTPHQAHSAHC